MSQTFEVVVRPGRHITLPAEMCDRLDLRTGDRLDMWLDGDRLVLRPKLAGPVDAWTKLRRAFSASAILDEDVQAEADRLRSRRTGKRRPSGQQ